MPLSYSQQTFEHMLWAVQHLSTLFVRGDDTLFIEFYFREKRLERAIYFAPISCEALELDMEYSFRSIAHEVLESL